MIPSIETIDDPVAASINDSEFVEVMKRARFDRDAPGYVFYRPYGNSMGTGMAHVDNESDGESLIAENLRPIEVKLDARNADTAV